jgi:hypothetical protein
VASPSTPSDQPGSHSSAHRRGRITAATLSALIIVAAQVAIPTPALAEDIVTVGDGTPASLPPFSPALLSFPVTAATGVDLSDPAVPTQIRVVQVLRNGVQLDIADAVTARIEPVIPAIMLTVATDRLPDSGTYTVLLAVERSTVRQVVTVAFIRPPGQVTTPATVAVRRTTSVFPSGPVDTVQPRLTLVMSGDTRLLTLSIRQLEAEDPHVDVHVDPDDLPATPGAALVLDYDVTGGLSPGTVTRTVQVTSPQLASPVNVTFTVTTRRHPALIGLALLVGVLLSLLLRMVLPRLVAWRRRRIQRQQLELQLAGLADEYPDRDFQDVVAQARRTLDGAKESAIPDAVSTARGTVGQALQRLQAELSTLDGTYRSHVAVLRRDWQLPADLMAAVTATRPKLAAADAALTARDARTAREQLDTVDQAAQEIARKAVDWGARARQGLGDLFTAVGNRNQGALGQLRDAVTRARDSAPQEASSPTAVPENLTQRLTAVHQTIDRYATVRTYLHAFAAESELIARELADRNQPAADLSEAAASLRAADRDHGGDPATAATPVAARVAALVDATHAAIREPLQARVDPDVETRLTSGDMVGAAEKMMSQLAGAPPAAGGPTRLGTAAETVLATATADASTQTSTEPAVVLPSARASLTDRLRAAPETFALAFAGAGAALVHTLVALVIVMLVGYGLFLPTWSGTLADVTQIIVWAFAIDLSVVGLTALLAPSPASPQPSA